MKSYFAVAIGALLFLGAVPSGNPQEMISAKMLLQRDLTSYAGADLLLSVAEITLAPGATGTKHRHPGPTYVYVLAGAVEAEFDGVPLRTIMPAKRSMRIRTSCTFPRRTRARRTPRAFWCTT